MALIYQDIDHGLILNDHDAFIYDIVGNTVNDIIVDNSIGIAIIARRFSGISDGSDLVGYRVNDNSVRQDSDLIRMWDGLNSV